MGKKKQQVMLGGRFVGSAVVGGLILTGVRRIPPFAGPFQSAADKIIAGGVMRLAKRGPANAFIKVGVAEGFATAMDVIVLPMLLGRTGLGSLLKLGAASGANTQRIANPLAVAT